MKSLYSSQPIKFLTRYIKIGKGNSVQNCQNIYETDKLNKAFLHDSFCPLFNAYYNE